MQENYQRRDSELDFDTFSWHEYRKCNKAMIDGSKFDIGMVCLSDELDIEHRHFLKQGIKTIQCRVTDDSRAFDFPARYRVDNALTPEIISFTHTYVGQVEKENSLRFAVHWNVMLPEPAELWSVLHEKPEANI